MKNKLQDILNEINNAYNENEEETTSNEDGTWSVIDLCSLQLSLDKIACCNKCGGKIDIVKEQESRFGLGETWLLECRKQGCQTTKFIYTSVFRYKSSICASI